MPMARLVQAAAVVADKLQRSEEFARYCTYLQGLSNKMAAARDTARAKMNDPNVLAHADLLKLKARRDDVLQVRAGMMGAAGTTISAPKATIGLKAKP